MKELLFHGGSVITVDDDWANAEAVVVRGAKIAFVGSLADAESRVSAHHERIDLNGNFLLPGFIDAHSHPLWAAKTRGAPVVDVRAATVPTYAALLAKVRRRVAIAKPGEYLLFFGLDPQLHPDMESPSRELLDEIAPQNPLGIQTSNCHALYMNSAGFDACGIGLDTKTPTGSIIERDEHGRPSGRIAEAITWTALETFYQSWGDIRLNAEFEATINAFVKHGITTVTEHLYLPFYQAYYQEALNRGWPLPRIAAYQQAVTAEMRVEDLELGDDRLWMAGVKIHADGSPFIGNIWLTKPYLDNDVTRQKMQLKPGHTGGLNYPQAYFEKMLRRYFSQGWQMSIHTQGDRTIDMVLDLLAKILAEAPRHDHRFRLEHCALMRSDQIDRALEMGVLCSFFINHITYWGAPIEDVLFGPERAAHYMPAGSACSKGMKISLHADTPMTDPSALELMAAAITRRVDDGRCLGREECLSPAQALRAVTVDAAYQIGKEDRLGTITPGKHADLVVLDQNPLEFDPRRLTEIGVRQTFLAGESVWQNDG